MSEPLLPGDTGSQGKSQLIDVQQGRQTWGSQGCLGGASLRQCPTVSCGAAGPLTPAEGP